MRTELHNYLDDAKLKLSLSHYRVQLCLDGMTEKEKIDGNGLVTSLETIQKNITHLENILSTLLL